MVQFELITELNPKNADILTAGLLYETVSAKSFATVQIWPDLTEVWPLSGRNFGINF